MTDRAAELAYTEGVRALNEQMASLESARSRVGVVFSIAAIGTGFISVAALKGHKGMPWLAWVAIAFLVVTMICAVGVLWPKQWKWTNKPSELAGAAWEGRTEDEVNRLLAGRLAGHIDLNDHQLSGIWWWVRGSVVASTISVIAWVLLLSGVMK